MTVDYPKCVPKQWSQHSKNVPDLSAMVDKFLLCRLLCYSSVDITISLLCMQNALMIPRSKTSLKVVTKFRLVQICCSKFYTTLVDALIDKIRFWFRILKTATQQCVIFISSPISLTLDQLHEEGKHTEHLSTFTFLHREFAISPPNPLFLYDLQT